MRMVRFFFTRRLIFTVCPDIATVGETREAYRAAGKAANIAKISVTATLAKSIGSFRQMGIIDADGKPQPRATDWRSDAKYPDVCSAIIAEIYPQELLDLFPDTQVDNATAKSWFMDTCSLGDNAAGKITSTFSMLKSGQIKADADVTKTTTAPKKAKTNKPQKSVLADNGANSVSVPPMPAVDANAPIMPTVAASPTPSVHIDLQIHISPDASPDQIDSIFASMAKHLYGRS